MTKEDVIRMAREAGFMTGEIDFADGKGRYLFIEPIGKSCNVELERFADLIAAAEREACANVCRAYIPTKDQLQQAEDFGGFSFATVSRWLHDAIRARINQ